MCNPSNIDIPVSFTHTSDLIRSMTKLLREKKTGTFNVTSNGTVSPFKVSPAPSYMKKDCIADLNLTSNTVSVLNTDKLFQHHITDDVDVQLLESISAITATLKS